MTGNTNLIEAIFTSPSDKWKGQRTYQKFSMTNLLYFFYIFLIFQGYQISVVVQYNVVLNDNSCTDISYKYSNTPILCSGILHFLRIYALLWCWPNAHANNVSRILYHLR